MPFRARQPLKRGGYCPTHEQVTDVDPDTGVALVHLFDPTAAALPDGSMFDLDNLLRAKVPLERTTTKVLGGDVFGLSDFLNNITEDEQANKDG